MTSQVDLLCVDCAGKDQEEDVSSLNEHGKIKDPWGWFTNQIGCFVPAIPTEDNTGWWGYLSVPNDGCEWWDKLPNRPEKEDIG